MTERRDDEEEERRNSRPRDRRNVVTLSRIAVLLAATTIGSTIGLIFVMTQRTPPEPPAPPPPRATGNIDNTQTDYAALTKPALGPEVTAPQLVLPGEAKPQAAPTQIDQEKEDARKASPRFAAAGERRGGQRSQQPVDLAGLQEKLLQMSLSGANAPTASSGTNAAQDLTALSAALNPGQGAIAAPGLGQTGAPPASTSSVDANLRFAASGRPVAGDDGWSRQRLQPPKSRYEIKAGTILNAALRTALHSDLPGDVVAQLTLDVRDSVTGRYVLLPAGTTVLGRTNSAIGNGQDRLQVIWTRLVLPNGKELALDSLTGADKSGAAGLADRVDYHIESIGLGAVLSTLISVGGNLARGNPTGFNERYSIRQSVGDSVAQSASNAGSRIVERQVNIPPTITVREGTPVTAIVSRTMVLEPYQPQQ